MVVWLMNSSLRLWSAAHINWKKGQQYDALDFTGICSCIVFIFPLFFLKNKMEIRKYLNALSSLGGAWRVLCYGVSVLLLEILKLFWNVSIIMVSFCWATRSAAALGGSVAYVLKKRCSPASNVPLCVSVHRQFKYGYIVVRFLFFLFSLGS